MDGCGGADGQRRRLARDSEDKEPGARMITWTKDRSVLFFSFIRRSNRQKWKMVHEENEETADLRRSDENRRLTADWGEVKRDRRSSSRNIWSHAGAKSKAHAVLPEMQTSDQCPGFSGRFLPVDLLHPASPRHMLAGGEAESITGGRQTIWQAGEQEVEFIEVLHAEIMGESAHGVCNYTDGQEALIRAGWSTNAPARAWNRHLWAEPLHKPLPPVCSCWWRFIMRRRTRDGCVRAVTHSACVCTQAHWDEMLFTLFSGRTDSWDSNLYQTLLIFLCRQSKLTTDEVFIGTIISSFPHEILTFVSFSKLSPT